MPRPCWLTTVVNGTPPSPPSTSGSTCCSSTRTTSKVHWPPLAPPASSGRRSSSSGNGKGKGTDPFSEAKNGSVPLSHCTAVNTRVHPLAVFRCSTRHPAARLEKYAPNYHWHTACFFPFARTSAPITKMREEIDVLPGTR